MNRYYEGRWNPYNRHDTGMYQIYRKGDGKYLGTVMRFMQSVSPRISMVVMFTLI